MTAHHGYSILLAALLRPDEARQQIERARMLDPLSPLVVTDAGFETYYDRRYEEARVALEEAIKASPGDPWPHFWLARTFQAQGQYDKAIAQFQLPGKAFDNFVPFDCWPGAPLRPIGSPQRGAENVGKARRPHWPGTHDHLPACAHKPRALGPGTGARPGFGGRTRSGPTGWSGSSRTRAGTRCAATPDSRTSSRRSDSHRNRVPARRVPLRSRRRPVDLPRSINARGSVSRQAWRPRI